MTLICVTLTLQVKSVKILTLNYVETEELFFNVHRIKLAGVPQRFGLGFGLKIAARDHFQDPSGIFWYLI